jgi:hypothetical protein
MALYHRGICGLKQVHGHELASIVDRQDGRNCLTRVSFTVGKSYPQAPPAGAVWVRVPCRCVVSEYGTAWGLWRCLLREEAEYDHLEPDVIRRAVRHLHTMPQWGLFLRLPGVVMAACGVGRGTRCLSLALRYLGPPHAASGVALFTRCSPRAATTPPASLYTAAAAA